MRRWPDAAFFNEERYSVETATQIDWLDTVKYRSIIVFAFNLLLSGVSMSESPSQPHRA